MTYRTILVHIDETTRRRTRAAGELVARVGARLVGLFLTSDYLHRYGAGASVAFLPRDDIDRILQGHAKAVADKAEDARLPVPILVSH